MAAATPACIRSGKFGGASSAPINYTDTDHADYVTFHIETVGCRYCAANLTDLQTQQAEKNESVQRRRRKYFQSSAGYLRKR